MYVCLYHIITSPWSGPEGVQLDITNISLTFEELNFAVLSHLTSTELVSLLNVASAFIYPLSYKFIVFYFAGHGDVDPNNGHAYVIPMLLNEIDDPKKVYIEKAIVSQFSNAKSPSLF